MQGNLQVAGIEPKRILKLSQQADGTLKAPRLLVVMISGKPRGIAITDC
jgi:hypothetical protein